MLWKLIWVRERELSMDYVLQTSEVEGGYDRVKVLNGIDLYVSKDEFVTIIGPNGCGKSTFLKVLFGLATHYSGEITYEGQNVSGWRTDELVNLGISYVPQVENVFPSLSVAENLQMGGINLNAAKTRNGIDRAIAMFPELGSRMNDVAASLSGGERQMLAISRALMSEPSFIMLDEPTAALSPRYQQQIIKNINELRSQGISILLVEQNARLSLEQSDRGYVFAGGRVVYTGGARSILENPDLGNYFLGVQD